MIIKIKDPQSGQTKRLEAVPEGTGSERHWLITFLTGETVLIQFRDGLWESQPEGKINSEFAQVIGAELKPKIDADFKKNIAATPKKPRPRLAKIHLY